jgi:hypothetical protein
MRKGAVGCFEGLSSYRLIDSDIPFDIEDPGKTGELRHPDIRVLGRVQRAMLNRQMETVLAAIMHRFDRFAAPSTAFA